MLLGAEVEGKPGRWAFPRESGGMRGWMGRLSRLDSSRMGRRRGGGWQKLIHDSVFTARREPGPITNRLSGGGKRGSIAVCSLPYIPRPSCFNQAINKFSGRFSRRYKARKSLAATLND